MMIIYSSFNYEILQKFATNAAVNVYHEPTLLKSSPWFTFSFLWVNTRHYDKNVSAEIRHSLRVIEWKMEVTGND